MGKVKRAQSGFMFYSNEVRKGLMEKNPGMKITEIASLIGKEWKTLNEGQKKKYQDMAEKDKARFAKEKAEASSESESEKKGKRKRGAKGKGGKADKKKKDPNAPKRPATGFLLYSQDKRKELLNDAKFKDMKMTELSKEIGAQWNKEKADIKEKYEKQAKVLKEKYEKEKAAYKPPKEDTSEDESEEESSEEEPKAKRGKAGSGKRASKRGSGKKGKESSSEEESD
jgi:hypothetical protein